MWRELGGRIVAGVLFLIILAYLIQWGAEHTGVDHELLQGYWVLAVAIITLLGAGSVLTMFGDTIGGR